MRIIIHILQMKLIKLPKVMDLVGSHIEMHIQVFLSLKHMLLSTMSTAPKREIL